ncbi:MAG: hypothetical protein ACFFE8_07445 [Candidatus Heimdallarchaeota archaeon]
MTDKVSRPKNHYSVRFTDKNSWNEFKEDLKPILREQRIKYQYSEKTPTFHILYKSPEINFKVIWEEDGGLLVSLQAGSEINKENVLVCREIYDLLLLFSGELVEGKNPYDWADSD